MARQKKRLLPQSLFSAHRRSPSARLREISYKIDTPRQDSFTSAFRNDLPNALKYTEIELGLTIQDKASLGA